MGVLSAALLSLDVGFMSRAAAHVAQSLVIQLEFG